MSDQKRATEIQFEKHERVRNSEKSFETLIQPLFRMPEKCLQLISV